MNFSSGDFSLIAGSAESRELPLQILCASRSFSGVEFGNIRISAREGGLDINVRKRSQVQVIQLRGQLRLGEPVDELRKAIDEGLAQGDSRFVLNIAEVPMIDSSGIGLLVQSLASTKKRGGNIKLVKPSPFAIKTLRLVGVYNLFEVFEEDDQAVESFG
jgi:anti-sigma B factor antagonist